MNQDPQLAFRNALNELVITLLAILPLQDKASRDTLPHGLPSPGSIERSETAVTDIVNITNHAANSGKSALVILRQNVLVYLIGQVAQQEKVNNCFEALQELLPLNLLDTSQGRISRSTSDIDIPFTNRDDELRLVLADWSPAHHILDGPIGYGKTRLLERLEEIFKLPQQRLERLEEIFKLPQQRYVCARVSAKDNQTMAKLTTSLCEKLGLTAISVVGTDGDVRKIGVRFGHEVLRTRFPNLPDSAEYRGVVLLFDDIGPQSPGVSRELLEVFIPAVEETLRTKSFFATESNAFRVILCGRYLAQFVASLVPKLAWELSVTTLRPFDYRVVWDTARIVLEGHENIEQTSAHILHLTGGHPYCMAEVLRFSREHPCAPETFVQLYSEDIWTNIVSRQLEEIRKSLPSHLLPICDRLSVFRIFNCDILRQLMESKAFYYDKDEFSLRDELVATHLYDPRLERLVRDAIVRRMLVLQLRLSKDASEFPVFCDDAYRMCLSVIGKNKGLQNLDLWTIECLFQALQKHADSIGAVEQRLALRKSFFDTVVPDVLEAFTACSREQGKELDTIDPRVQKLDLGALVQVMKEDTNWDFRFDVNYYLRGEFYSEEPFEQLVDAVRAWREEVIDAESKS